MTKPNKLTASELELVEGLARFYEAQGAPRIGGRVLGLLMLVDVPMSLGELATTLKASRASISTNVRQLEAAGLIEHHTFPGDRRDYYRFSDKAWEQRINTGLAALRSFREVAENGLSRIPSRNAVARERLTEMRAFCTLFESAELVALEQWRDRTAKKSTRKV